MLCCSPKSICNSDVCAMVIAASAVVLTITALVLGILSVSKVYEVPYVGWQPLFGITAGMVALMLVALKVCDPNKKN